MMPTNASGVFEPQTAYSFRMTYPPQSDVDLKPCPFCGSHGKDVYVDEFWERYNKPYFVTCARCGTNGPYADKKEIAIEYWNRRVTE